MARDVVGPAPASQVYDRYGDPRAGADAPPLTPAERLEAQTYWSLHPNSPAATAMVARYNNHWPLWYLREL